MNQLPPDVPSANQIVAKYIDALGGSSAIENYPPGLKRGPSILVGGPSLSTSSRKFPASEPPSSICPTGTTLPRTMETPVGHHLRPACARPSHWRGHFLPGRDRPAVANPCKAVVRRAAKRKTRENRRQRMCMWSLRSTSGNLRSSFTSMNVPACYCGFCATSSRRWGRNPTPIDYADYRDQPGVKHRSKRSSPVLTRASPFKLKKRTTTWP